MKRLNKDNDIILIPLIKDCKGEIVPFQALDNITYTLYTNKTDYKCIVTTEDIDGSDVEEDSDTISFVEGKIYIPTDITQKFDTGILRFDIHFSIPDENFEDGQHDYDIAGQSTNIYIE